MSFEIPWYMEPFEKAIKNYDYQSAHDSGYLEGLAAGIDQGKSETIVAVLEIISQERDKTENVTHKTIENIISAVLALKGEQK